MMATTAPVKRETLKNIGNVPDWVLKQRTSKDKKESVKPVRPRPASKQAKPSISAPAAVVAKPTVIPQPIKEEVKIPQENAVQNPSGSKVRKIYSREFLIKFKYTAPSFPPGAVTPLDLITQYNKEFELKERLATQDNSSLNTHKPVPSPAAFSTTPSTDATPVAEAKSAASGEKKLKKKKEGDKTEGVKREKTFKLRLGTTDESILRSPLFRATTTAKTPVRAVAPSPSNIVCEDKENSTSTAKTSRSTSVTKVRASPLVSKKEIVKTTKLPTTPAAAPAPTPATPVIPVSAPAPTPAPVVIATPAPAPIAEPTVVPQPVSDAVMEESKDELMDVLSKKLKAVLKETDPRRLAQRQKQIDYGKATAGYQDYTNQVAKSKRKREDPKTPNKYQVCSKRSWDGQVRKWRRMLHMYDPAELKDQPNDMEERNFEITEADLLAEENALRD